MSREKVGHQFIGVPIFTVGQQEGFGIVRTNPSEQGYRRRSYPGKHSPIQQDGQLIVLVDVLFDVLANDFLELSLRDEK